MSNPLVEEILELAYSKFFKSNIKKYDFLKDYDDKEIRAFVKFMMFCQDYNVALLQTDNSEKLQSIL